MNTRSLQAGTAVAGYRLLREVGRGASGAVFEATGPDGATVALKLLVPPPLLPEGEREVLARRFLREARALAAVDHPNVVRVLDAGEAEDTFYLALEFVDGPNLRQLLARRGPLAAEEVAAIALQLGAALDAVHRAGIVHRDVKPENLVLLPDGRVKLTDFGVAWMASEATLTRSGAVLGSPAYMSPEQILGRPVDARSDVFSAAATLYQLLTGRLPFEGSSLLEMAHRVAYEPPAPLPPEVPPALSRALLRGLEKSPGARYATGGALAEAIRASLPPARSGHLAPAVQPAGAVEPPAAVATVLAAPPVPTCRCFRRRPAIGACHVCGRPLCEGCAQGRRAPFHCVLHAPLTLFGVSLVRLEVALAALLFLLLLLSLSPLGYAALRR